MAHGRSDSYSGDLLYFGNPCGDAVIRAMHQGLLGLIDTPLQQMPRRVEQAHQGRVIWCADNGCFTDRWEQQQWWDFLLSNDHRADRCAFATAPDVVGDARATLERSTPWLPKIRQLGYPVAFVAQDGISTTEIPWDSFDVLFLGGSDRFKLGPEGAAVCAEAVVRHDKRVHMGRVNSRKRIRYAASIGCSSADGTFLRFGPKKNLPSLLHWLHPGGLSYWRCWAADLL